MTKLIVFLKSELARQMPKSKMLEEVSKIIAENRSNLFSHDSITGDTPLHLAAELVGDNDLIAQLIDSGADVNARSKDGCTALHRAVFAAINARENVDRFIGVAKLLITRGVDIDVRALPGKAVDLLEIGLDPEFTKDETALDKLNGLMESFGGNKKRVAAADEKPSASLSGPRGLRIEIPKIADGHGISWC